MKWIALLGFTLLLTACGTTMVRNVEYREVYVGKVTKKIDPAKLDAMQKKCGKPDNVTMTTIVCY